MNQNKVSVDVIAYRLIEKYCW